MNDPSPQHPKPGVSNDPDYRVLARKYRPVDFSGLIGQEALIRTLGNAIAQGRLAHGFMLTGVRGVGKTTTARILARCFNCIGADGKGEATATPCGVCQHCTAITEDRHVDVVEMDAASRTGIEDIRELIEGVRYRPVSARYKVYIIDEVHMLSEKAFNALLKTLEEPPPHVKFIFATTEIRKVPVTVLSRCQRFDLRRVGVDELARHFGAIAGREGATLSAGALGLIARAADGSVRDGLSLLDQAIALAPSGSQIGEQSVRDMLGLADRTQLIELYQSVLDGETGRALDQLAEMYQSGADPGVLFQDLLELTHWLARTKIMPGDLDDPSAPEAERQWGRKVGPLLGQAVLARLWQMLLKGLGEIQSAPQPMAAAEMALIRVIHGAQLPDPAELLRRLSAEDEKPAGKDASPRKAGASLPDRRPATSAVASNATPRAIQTAHALAEPASDQAALELPMPQSFQEVVDLFKTHREGLLCAHLQGDVHLVKFEPGRIEFRPGPKAPANLANRIAAKLGEWTARRWLVGISADSGEPTIKEQAASRDAAMREQALHHPIVKAAMTIFPGARIESVRDLTQQSPAGNSALDYSSENDPT
jgi:DNA polymerase-3 subunit gamma/tau